MAVIRIVTTDCIAQQLHAEAVRENRSLSKMGELCLRESLDRRRDERANRAEVARLVQALRSPSGPDAARPRLMWRIPTLGCWIVSASLQPKSSAVENDRDAIIGLILTPSGVEALQAMPTATA